MALVGPGAIKQNEVAPDPSLKGASEQEYVEILNPLTDDFMVQVAQDVPVNMPFQVRHDESGRVQYLSKNESDVRTNYGLNLKNPDHTGRKQIYNNTVIPAGKSKIFRGNEAQVVVKQIVNEILQRRGKNGRRLISDPVQRREIEDEIIVRRGFVQELMDSNFQSERAQTTQAINKANEVTDEFPGLNESTGSIGAARVSHQKFETGSTLAGAGNQKDGDRQPDTVPANDSSESTKKDKRSKD